MLIYIFLFERGRECKQGDGQREREREDLKQTPRSAWSPTRGSIPWPLDHDPSRNQESDAQPTEPLRCPYADIFNSKLIPESHGAPGWLSQLGVRLQLRSWSRSLWFQTLRRAPCWQLRAWSLLWIRCPPLSLSAPSCSVLLCLSKINIKKKH